MITGTFRASAFQFISEYGIRILIFGLDHGFYIRWLLISCCARMMKTRSFSEKKIGFDDSFDVTKRLQQIEMSDLLHVCA